MVDLVQVAGSRPVLFVAGTCVEQIDLKHWAHLLETYPTLRDFDYDHGKPNRRLMELCRQMQLPRVDLLPDFSAHRGEPLHYHYDGHFNEAGHELAARIVYEKLVQEALVPTN